MSRTFAELIVFSKAGKSPFSGSNTSIEKLVTLVGEFNRLVAIARGIVEILGLFHHFDGGGRIVQQIEIAVAGKIRVELLKPVSLEIDGIGKDEPGQRTNPAGGDQVVDFVFRLFTDPAINRHPRFFRILRKIQGFHPRIVVLRQVINKSGTNWYPCWPHKALALRRMKPLSSWSLVSSPRPVSSLARLRKAGWSRS